ncbi:MAG: helix-turn-helix domain-containing protein [Prevotella sp.]|nr:helix-turn-helix domain-containing protein [Prevotella sp.]
MKKQKIGGSLKNSNGQDAEPTDNKENLQSFSQERQAVIKEKLDKWCEELGYKDTTVKMMLDYPDYSNDIISVECGFSSRSYLYRIFKEKEGCSPTVWRAKIQ